MAAKAFWPLGSGMGTFVPVYGIFEQPEDVHLNFYVNHAHNDLLEVWLEAGVAGLAFIGAFVLWLLRRIYVLWWRNASTGFRETDLLLARAASIAVLLLLMHSLVDYPLRTGAMMTLFAFVCALTIEPLAPGEREQTGRPGRRSIRPSQPISRPSTRSRAAERWGEDIEWPDAWS